MHLVDREDIAEERGRLAVLAVEHGLGVLLDLMGVRIEAPLTGVLVAPLRTHHGTALGRTTGKPRREELLSPPVRTRRIDVPDAGLPRGVEDPGGPVAHRGHLVVAGEVLVVADGDVGGPAEGGQSDADP